MTWEEMVAIRQKVVVDDFYRMLSARQISEFNRRHDISDRISFAMRAASEIPTFVSPRLHEIGIAVLVDWVREADKSAKTRTRIHG